MATYFSLKFHKLICKFKLHLLVPPPWGRLRSRWGSSTARWSWQTCPSRRASSSSARSRTSVSSIECTRAGSAVRYLKDVMLRVQCHNSWFSGSNPEWSSCPTFWWGPAEINDVIEMSLCFSCRWDVPEWRNAYAQKYYCVNREQNSRNLFWSLYALEEILADVESAEPGELLLVLVLVAKVGLLDLHLVACVLLPAILKV